MKLSIVTCNCSSTLLPIRGKRPKNFPFGKNIFEGAIDGGIVECPLTSSMLVVHGSNDDGAEEDDVGMVSHLLVNIKSFVESEYLECTPSVTIDNSDAGRIVVDSSSFIHPSLALLF